MYRRFARPHYTLLSQGVLLWPLKFYRKIDVLSLRHVDAANRFEDLTLVQWCCSSNRNTGDPNGVRITEGDPVVSVSALLQLVERLHQFCASKQGRQLCESMKTDVPPFARPWDFGDKLYNLGFGGMSFGSSMFSSKFLQIPTPWYLYSFAQNMLSSSCVAGHKIQD